MNVVLLNPPFIGNYSRASRSPGTTIGGTIYYPIWLAYAAGVLDKNGFNIKIIDAPAENYSVTNVIEMSKKFQSRLIVVDTSTPSIYNDVTVAEQLKEVMPSTFVVLVGTHPSALPEETLRLSNKIDAVTIGEYDYTIRDLAFCLENKGDLRTVDGLVFREGNNIIHNKPRSLIENLDELPFITEVYKKYLDVNHYFYAASDHPSVMIMSGRGCPYKCFFCLYPQVFHSRRFRPRSAANIVDEFEYVKENLPEVREISIEDDTFSAIREHVWNVCQEILKRKLKMKWHGNVRASLDYETMLLMKEAGCQQLGVGFESADQNSLNLMRKGITVEQIKEFANNARKANLPVHGCFMLGNPGETKETMEKTLKLAKELNTDTMQFYPLTVYPGTEAYEWARNNNYLITSDYSQWLNNNGDYNCLINLPDVSAEEINAFCRRAIREYYLRPRYILMKAKRMLLSPRAMRRTLISARTFFKYLLRTRK